MKEKKVKVHIVKGEEDYEFRFKYLTRHILMQISHPNHGRLEMTIARPDATDATAFWNKEDCPNCDD